MAKKLVLPLSLLLVTLGLWFATRSSPTPAVPKPQPPAAVTAPVTPKPEAPSPAPAPSAPAAPVPPATAPAAKSAPMRSASPVPAQRPATTPPAPTITVIGAPGSAEIARVQRVMRDYRTLFGQNPVGSNAEITKALMGDNPKGAKILPAEGMTVNGAGELVDQWGTPYFFHQLSGQHMEIRSAGPDKMMWTGDDILSN